MLLKNFGKAALATVFLLASLLAADSLATETDAANPLRLYQGEGDRYLQATLQADLAVFAQGHSYFGNSREVLGKTSDSWGESLLRPGIEGRYTLPRYQKMYGRLDAVQANTFGGIDAGGTNVALGDVSNLRLQNAAVGWRSGTLFRTLDEDFLDISFGRQPYSVGNKFLFSSQGGGGYDRAAYYLGGRRAAEYAGIVRMKTGGWGTDLFYLKTDDRANSNTRAGGTTLEYAFEKMGTVGGGIYAIKTDKPARPVREPMTAFDFRGSLQPFAQSAGLAALHPLKFEAEYVYEDKEDGLPAGKGWYLAASYQWREIPCKPELTYRYASFDAQYDTLFYGFSDWGSWFQGEILGEYVLWNSNLHANMLRLKVQPFEPLTVSLFYFHFTLDDAAAFTRDNMTISPVTSTDYTDELNLAIDWAVNPHLTLSLVGAYALPDEGAVQHTGGNENWSYMMLAGCVKF
ncbi:MAG: alginate export family protein [Desulfobulbaceae bacterium]|nr:alginate export family protein [Desulfobulbaceae bacterium]